MVSRDRWTSSRRPSGPTQVRIGRLIAVPPPRGDAAFPEIASVVDDQIVLQAYRGRLR